MPLHLSLLLQVHELLFRQLRLRLDVDRLVVLHSFTVLLVFNQETRFGPDQVDPTSDFGVPTDEDLEFSQRKHLLGRELVQVTRDVPQLLFLESDEFMSAMRKSRLLEIVKNELYRSVLGQLVALFHRHADIERVFDFENRVLHQSLDVLEDYGRGLPASSYR